MTLIFNAKNAKSQNTGVVTAGGGFFVYTSSVAAGAWGSTATFTANTLYLYPIIFAHPTTFASVNVTVTTLGAGSSIRLGLYRADGVAFEPKTLEADFGTVDSTSTGLKTISISNTFYGRYYTAMICNSATPTLNAQQPANALSNLVYGSPAVNSSGSVLLTSFSIASVSSYHTALPSDISGDTLVFETSATSKNQALGFSK